MAMKFTLWSGDQGKEVKQFEKTLHEDLISVGRDSENLLQVPDTQRKVSSKHALIELKGGRYSLKDTWSKNGTRLNGERLSPGKSYPLNDGDRIQIGDFVLACALVTPDMKDWDEEKTLLRVAVNQQEVQGETLVLSNLTDGAGQPPEEPEAIEPPSPVGPPAEEPPTEQAPPEIEAPPSIPPEESSVLSDEEVTEKARELSRLLGETYAKLHDAAPESRKATLAVKIKERVHGLPLNDLEKVFETLRQYFPEKAYERERLLRENADFRTRLKDWERNQALYETAYQELCQLSTNFSGAPETMRSIEEVKRFCLQVRVVSEVMLKNFLDALKGRQQFEQEFDVQVTRILSWEKNPVKSAATHQDLGKYLLDWKTGDKAQDAVQHLEKAFRDIMMHQLGLLSGAKQSLRAFLEALSPEVLEKEMLDSPDLPFWKKLLYSIPLIRQRAVWKQFVLKQKNFSQDHKRAFETIFGPNFSKGYIDLLKNLDRGKAED